LSASPASSMCWMTATGASPFGTWRCLPGERSGGEKKDRPFGLRKYGESVRRVHVHSPAEGGESGVLHLLRRVGESFPRLPEGEGGSLSHGPLRELGVDGRGVSSRFRASLSCGLPSPGQPFPGWGRGAGSHQHGKPGGPKQKAMGQILRLLRAGEVVESCWTRIWPGRKGFSWIFSGNRPAPTPGWRFWR